MGLTTRYRGLSGLLRWHACMLRELPSGSSYIRVLDLGKNWFWLKRFQLLTIGCIHTLSLWGLQEDLADDLVDIGGSKTKLEEN
jgi:hypothetical protein